ncbi:CPBP family intramembrane glutamic endopeptidase [Halopiger djelfimassiliensis]|uniref:CPBP family intramembrane glutamic endopeptidase n=1 Tax=Halopiger djelfimassiliensis TaxID=1293047 RepID=UPI0006777E12|nr:CPBP family intramembrane glutamic endopeptidase [Halopiger djelfimassiliensis]
MTQWTAFAGVTGVVLALLLVLSHLTQSAVSDVDSGSPDDYGREADAASAGSSSVEPFGRGQNEIPEPGSNPDDALETGDDRPHRDRHAGDQLDPESLSTGMVLANVALSQGVFGLVLLGAVLYTGVPADALGIEFSTAYLETGLVVGTAVGTVLYVGNEIGAAVATRFGFDHDEQLRELLAPESAGGWLVLVGVVLPIIAVFEELLFRAALIGAIATGFGVSPAVLAVVSSVAFALGHGMQGSVGIVVTGLLGLVLAAVFIVTGSFLVVVVAHYVINALEFVVHEGFDFEWATALEHDGG